MGLGLGLGMELGFGKVGGFGWGELWLEIGLQRVGVGVTVGKSRGWVLGLWDN